MKKISFRYILVLLFIFNAFGFAKAQTTEITLTFTEQFFDKFFEAVFTKLKNPTFTVSENKSNDVKIEKASYKTEDCAKTVTLLREVGGTFTAVKFKENKIFAPLAFSGKYDVPLIGCLEFTGVAETNINLEFNAEKQTLYANVAVQNIYLQNVPKLASSVLTKFVQSEIDKKINPVELLKTDKLSFALPLKSAEGSLEMKAVNVRNLIQNGFLHIFIGYDFVKAK